MNKSILVVDDESSIRSMLRMALENDGFDVVEANNVPSAQEKITEQQPDLILLDWMMPGTSGVELIRRLNESNQQIPIIMLTAKDGDENSIKALDMGADDYISKPFSPRALVSRINAVLRRFNSGKSDSTEEETLSSGLLTLNTLSHKATIEDTPLKLSATEFRLLDFFIRNEGRVFSRSHLLDQVWGESTFIEDRTIDVHIRRLRKILEPMGVSDYIQTVRGVGYRFEPIKEDV